MVSNCSKRLRFLNDHVGHGKLKAKIKVDQVYAADQHESLHYKHPRGGRAKYLEGPLFENHRDYFNDLADAVLDPTGPSMTARMLRVGREVRNDTSENTPVEFGDLARSGDVSVYEGSSLVMYDPPSQERLTDAEHLAKDYMRAAGLGYR